MKSFRNPELSLIIAFAISLGACAGSFAQDGKSQSQGGPSWGPAGSWSSGAGPGAKRGQGGGQGSDHTMGPVGSEKDTVEARIKRQRHRITRALQQGSIPKDKAMQLKSGLDDLEAKVAAQRQANGGGLKKEELVQAENSLNQSNEMIRSYEGAGTKVVDNGKVLGPTWSPGKDGAQNSGGLLKKMKQENAREQRQYKQAMEQTLEQQQLNYEKQTMQKFQKQRNGILQQQGDLKQVRKDTGAD
jgi:hypothetical protein